MFKRQPPNILYIDASGVLTIHIAFEKKQRFIECASFCTSIRRVMRRKSGVLSLQKIPILESRFRFNASPGLRSANGEPRSRCRKTLPMRHSSSMIQCLHRHRLRQVRLPILKLFLTTLSIARLNFKHADLHFNILLTLFVIISNKLKLFFHATNC